MVYYNPSYAGDAYKNGVSVQYICPLLRIPDASAEFSSDLRCQVSIFCFGSHFGRYFMKARIIQPMYSLDFSRSDELFEKHLEALRACDDSLDIIVCPESFSVPCYASTREQYMR